MNRLIHTIALCIIVSFFFSPTIIAQELIPFLLPWNDASDSITNVKSLLNTPAGKTGFLRVKDGRFVDANGDRVRLFGVNLSFSGNFPNKSDAEQLAARMAKFGINCVRLHHTDTSRAPRGIWKAGANDTQTIDLNQQNKMDYLIYQLKQHGIYTDINLKIGREVTEADGIPDADQLPHYNKGTDHYLPKLIELQKEYARDILTHKNRYTGARYVNEPAIAIVEIVNESGLVNKWNAKELDNIPSQFLAPLQEKWNQFLRQKYNTTKALRSAWQPERVGTGQELLTKGLSSWALEQHQKARATKRLVPQGPNGDTCLEIETTTAGDVGWHVQTKYTPLAIEKGQYLEGSIQLKADRGREITIALQQDHSPWHSIDQRFTFWVGKSWKEYHFKFSANQTDSKVRLSLTNLGSEKATLWIYNPSLIDSSPKGLQEKETLENQTVSIFKREIFGDRSKTAQRDWAAFLVEQESAFYRDMQAFLKDELGCQPMVSGTQLGFGTVLSQLENDFIDHHGYWKHPQFPNVKWDMNDWIVENESMVNEPENTLQGIMLNRIDGEAFTVTEYNHPAPITYSSECAPLLAAYAAFQDWDGIFLYCYSHTNDYETRTINSFFDIIGHSPKMMTLPAAAHMFLRGDIAPAKEKYVKTLSPADYIDFLMEQNFSLWNRPLREMGTPWQTPYIHRTALRIAEEDQSPSTPDTPQDTSRVVSDTNELVWDFHGNRSHVLLKSKQTKGFIGFPPRPMPDAAHPEIDLGHGVVLSVGETMQNWANILLSYMKTDPEGEHWLLCATGYHENEGMEWTNAQKNSVGTHWGDGKPLIEPIPLKIQFNKKSENIILYSLDEKGQRKQKLDTAIQPYNQGKQINLMNNEDHLWYEVVFTKSKISDARLY